LKIVTDASPDYSDLPSLVRSVTSKWPTEKEKCWAMFYWNHQARRQTAPMELHGLALTDPIRQFNDYGYTMCSTISGINCAIWNAMGLKAKYWDISNHTVPEVFYDGRWHMYDNSLTAIYTLCDGTTVAGVEDIGREGACEASGGKTEPGHIARYHCLCATSPNGFLSGADTARSLDEESRCFTPNALKYRSYYYDWDAGHRYILNVRRGEAYVREARHLGDDARFYVPNHGKDPDPRYGLRGNGVWHYQPSLKPSDWTASVHSAVNAVPVEPAGLRPGKAGVPAEIVFKANGANVITSQEIRAVIRRKGPEDEVRLAVSVTNGLRWKEVWTAEKPGESEASIALCDEVNGAYEVLVRVTLLAKAEPADAVLASLGIKTFTMLNAKTLPGLNLGKNTVHVGAGDPTESIVFWPELQGGKYKELVVEEKNIASTPKHPEYMGTLHPAVAKEDAHVVYRLDAPRDIVRLTYGGRFYNRAPKSHIDLLHSFDGKEWTKSWSLTETAQPWDVIRYETVDVPAGCRSVWVKYLMNTTDPAPSGCSIYAMRMEANCRLADPVFRPLLVSFAWKELQKDRSLVERGHVQVVDRVPFRYVINVGGEDHPVVTNMMILGIDDVVDHVKLGYANGDPGGEKWIGRWQTVGKNLAVGKPYAISAPSIGNWGMGDPDGKKLTDGVAGPPYAGGTSYRFGAGWNEGANPVIQLDLGAPADCASFGMNFHGYPWWDALQGEIRDTVEVLTSLDGQAWTSRGFLHTDWRWKDLPVNFMIPDDGFVQGATFRLVPEKPVQARHVKYQVTNRRIFCCTELEVLDAIRHEPFDLRVALPDEP
jgi:hypothetical protein